jgi:hypothetical protein
MQHKNDQHTTPKCYLKNFSADGKFVFRKHKRVDKVERVNKELKQPVSLKSATVRDNFYTVQSGNEPMLVETLIYDREIENFYPTYYKIFTDSTIVGLPSMEDRSRALMCLLSLHCRTPKQFENFLKEVPKEFNYELDKIKEDYKGAHLVKTLTSFVEAHQFKIFRIATISDSSEFITSDNPVLIINKDGYLVNSEFREQFNKNNKIIIPLDPKHCCIMTNASDRNGIELGGKLFYNKIERIDVDCKFVQQVNFHMMGSADKYLFGSENYLNAFFSLWKFTE